MKAKIVTVSFEEYKAIDAANAHGLMLFERSPAHFYWSKTNQTEPTPAQQLGTLAHMAILEPDEFKRLVRVEPNVNKRTKAGKTQLEEWRDSLPENAVIASLEQVELCLQMATAVQDQPYAKALLSDGNAEQTMLWTDSDTGVACKARADWICSGHDVLVDLKTAQDASMNAFQRASGNFRYHMQAAFYTMASEACGLSGRAFIFIVVETAPPFGVALYQLDEEAMHAGHVRIRHALERYADCLSSGKWPMYPTEIQTLTLSKWAL